MTSQNLVNITLPTSTDLHSKQYFAVSVDSNGKAVVATAAKNCIGFLQNTPDGSTDKSATVAIFGITKAAITDTIVIGGQLEIASGGTLVNHASGVIVATALEAGATGDIISVLFMPNNGLLS